MIIELKAFYTEFFSLVYMFIIDNKISEQSLFGCFETNGKMLYSFFLNILDSVKQSCREQLFRTFLKCTGKQNLKLLSNY